MEPALWRNDSARLITCSPPWLDRSSTRRERRSPARSLASPAVSWTWLTTCCARSLTCSVAESSCSGSNSYAAWLTVAPPCGLHRGCLSVLPTSGHQRTQFGQNRRIPGGIASNWKGRSPRRRSGRGRSGGVRLPGELGGEPRVRGLGHDRAVGEQDRGNDPQAVV